MNQVRLIIALQSVIASGKAAIALQLFVFASMFMAVEENVMRSCFRVQRRSP
jgi:hypothetical protein